MERKKSMTKHRKEKKKPPRVSKGRRKNVYDAQKRGRETEVTHYSAIDNHQVGVKIEPLLRALCLEEKDCTKNPGEANTEVLDKNTVKNTPKLIGKDHEEARRCASQRGKCNQELRNPRDIQ